MSATNGFRRQDQAEVQAKGARQGERPVLVSRDEVEIALSEIAAWKFVAGPLSALKADITAKMDSEYNMNPDQALSSISGIIDEFLTKLRREIGDFQQTKTMASWLLEYYSSFPDVNRQSAMRETGAALAKARTKVDQYLKETTEREKIEAENLAMEAKEEKAGADAGEESFDEWVTKKFAEIDKILERLRKPM